MRELCKVNFNQCLNESLYVIFNLNLEWCIDGLFWGSMQLSEKFNLDGNIEMQVFS